MTFRTRGANTASLEPVEFLSRFVSHVLPSRFDKIRHYGLLATGKAKERWQLAAKLLGSLPATAPQQTESSSHAKQTVDWQSALCELTGIDSATVLGARTYTADRRALSEGRPH